MHHIVCCSSSSTVVHSLPTACCWHDAQPHCIATFPSCLLSCLPLPWCALSHVRAMCLGVAVEQLSLSCLSIASAHSGCCSVMASCGESRELRRLSALRSFAGCWRSSARQPATTAAATTTIAAAASSDSRRGGSSGGVGCSFGGECLLRSDAAVVTVGVAARCDAVEADEEVVHRIAQYGGGSRGRQWRNVDDSRASRMGMGSRGGDSSRRCRSGKSGSNHGGALSKDTRERFAGSWHGRQQLAATARRERSE